MIVREDDNGGKEGDGHGDVDKASDQHLLFLVGSDFLQSHQVVADGGGDGGQRAVGAGVAGRNQADDEHDGGGGPERVEDDFGVDAVGLVVGDEAAEVDAAVLGISLSSGAAPSNYQDR